jgi:GTP-binding protein HflX
MTSTTASPDRAFLFGIDTGKGPWSAADSLEELAQLARTAGFIPAGRALQKREAPHPGTYMGLGKLDEVADALTTSRADMLIIDDEVSPAQQRTLEKRFDVPVVDRTALILEIFARHARTREGQLQVELAQYEYLLPRLTGMWTHLERQAGGRRGGVGVRGPGETRSSSTAGCAAAQSLLRKELKRSAATDAAPRPAAAQQAPVVALTGYTNAGRAACPTGSRGRVLAADQLFATLIRRAQARLPGGGNTLNTIP